MHNALKDIPARILSTAIGALTQANTHSVYMDPGMEHREQMSILTTALAGELFIKAIIAREHPLLIFKDLFHLDQTNAQNIEIEQLIKSGRTYGFDQLPRLLWVTTGERIPDSQIYEEVRAARNSVQHLCSPYTVSLQSLSLDFIYKIIDPLIYKYFGLYAIEYHEDFSIGYDYVVDNLISRELHFSIPKNFQVGEIDLQHEIGKTSKSYANVFGKKLIDAQNQTLSMS